MSQCKACQAAVPELYLGRAELDVVVRALEGGSTTLAVLEVKNFTACSDQQAAAWVTHVLSCAHAWPIDQEDEGILQQVSQAFAEAEKPEHFTDFTHCDECQDHDEVLRRNTRETLQRKDLGNAGWDPISFCSEEGLAYYFPVLARYALLSDIWSTHSWYGDQLAFHLSWKGKENQFFAYCSLPQRRAIGEFLIYLKAKRRELILRNMCEDNLEEAIQVWSH